MNYTDKAFGIYPLWLCPLPLPSKLNTDDAPAFEVDRSRWDDRKAYARHWLWGYGPSHYGPSQYEDFVKANRDLKDKFRGLDGMKWLYAHTY